MLKAEEVCACATRSLSNPEEPPRERKRRGPGAIATCSCGDPSERNACDDKMAAAKLERSTFFDLFKAQCFDKDLGPISLNWFEELTAEALPYESNTCRNHDCNVDGTDESIFRTPKQKPSSYSQLDYTPIIFKDQCLSSPLFLSPTAELDKSRITADSRNTNTHRSMCIQSRYQPNEVFSPSSKCLNESPAIIKDMFKTPLRDTKYLRRTQQHDSKSDICETLFCTPKLMKNQTRECISESLGAEVDPEMSWSSSLATPPSPTVIIDSMGRFSGGIVIRGMSGGEYKDMDSSYSYGDSYKNDRFPFDEGLSRAGLEILQVSDMSGVMAAFTNFPLSLPLQYDPTNNEVWWEVMKKLSPMVTAAKIYDLEKKIVQSLFSKWDNEAEKNSIAPPTGAQDEKHKIFESVTKSGPDCKKDVCSNSSSDAMKAPWKQTVANAVKDKENYQMVENVLEGMEDVLSIFFTNGKTSAMRRVKNDCRALRKAQTILNQNSQSLRTEEENDVIPLEECLEWDGCKQSMKLEQGHENADDHQKILSKDTSAEYEWSQLNLCEQSMTPPGAIPLSSGNAGYENSTINKPKHTCDSSDILKYKDEEKLNKVPFNIVKVPDTCCSEKLVSDALPEENIKTHSEKSATVTNAPYVNLPNQNSACRQNQCEKMCLVEIHEDSVGTNTKLSTPTRQIQPCVAKSTPVCVSGSRSWGVNTSNDLGVNLNNKTLLSSLKKQTKFIYCVKSGLSYQEEGNKDICLTSSNDRSLSPERPDTQIKEEQNFFSEFSLSSRPGEGGLDRIELEADFLRKKASLRPVKNDLGSHTEECAHSHQNAKPVEKEVNGELNDDSIEMKEVERIVLNVNHEEEKLQGTKFLHCFQTSPTESAGIGKLQSSIKRRVMVTAGVLARERLQVESLGGNTIKCSEKEMETSQNCTALNLTPDQIGEGIKNYQAKCNSTGNVPQVPISESVNEMLGCSSLISSKSPILADQRVKESSHDVETILNVLSPDLTEVRPKSGDQFQNKSEHVTFTAERKQLDTDNIAFYSLSSGHTRELPQYSEHDQTQIEHGKSIFKNPIAPFYKPGIVDDSLGGFKTASNKKIHISEKNLTKGHILFKEIESHCLEHKTEKKKDSLEVINCFNIPTSEMHFNGFKTASDKEINVSENTLAKGRLLFKDIEDVSYEALGSTKECKANSFELCPKPASINEPDSYNMTCRKETNTSESPVQMSFKKVKLQQNTVDTRNLLDLNKSSNLALLQKNANGLIGHHIPFHTQEHKIKQKVISCNPNVAFCDVVKEAYPSDSATKINSQLNETWTESQKAEVSELSSILENADSQFEFTQFKQINNGAKNLDTRQSPNECSSESQNLNNSDVWKDIDFNDSFAVGEKLESEAGFNKYNVIPDVNIMAPENRKLDNTGRNASSMVESNFKSLVVNSSSLHNERTQGFNLASGKSINITNEALVKAVELFSDLDNVSELFTCSLKESRKKGLEEHSLSVSRGINTASCANKATGITGNDSEHLPSCHDDTEHITKLIKDAKVELNVNETKQTQYIHNEVEKSTSHSEQNNEEPNFEKPAPASLMKGFQTDNGKSAILCPPSLEKGRDIFADKSIDKFTVPYNTKTQIRVTQFANTSSSLHSVNLEPKHTPSPGLKEKSLISKSDSKDFMLGFCTAGGKKVNISDDSLAKVRHLFDEEIPLVKENKTAESKPSFNQIYVRKPGNLSEELPYFKNAVGPSHCLEFPGLGLQDVCDKSGQDLCPELKSKYVKKCDFFTSNENGNRAATSSSSSFPAGFITGKGMPINIEETSLLKARNIFNNISPPSDETNVDQEAHMLNGLQNTGIKKNMTVSAETCIDTCRHQFVNQCREECKIKKNDCSLKCKTHEEMRKEDKGINDNSLQKTRQQFSETSGTVDTGSKTIQTKAVSKNPMEESENEQSITVFNTSGHCSTFHALPFSFATASGKKVSVSEQALKQVKTVAELEETSKIPTFHENKYPSNVAEDVHSPPHHIPILKTVSFSTASGKSVPLSDESLKKARKIFSEMDDNQLAHQLKHESTFYDKCKENILREETKKTVKESVEIKELATSKKINHLNASVSRTSFGFNTASGKQVSVSESALQKVKGIFEEFDDIGRLMEIEPSIRKHASAETEGPSSMMSRPEENATTKMKRHKLENMKETHLNAIQGDYTKNKFLTKAQYSESSISPSSLSILEGPSTPSHDPKSFADKSDLLHKSKSHLCFTASHTPENDFELEAAESTKAFMDDEDLTEMGLVRDDAVLNSHHVSNQRAGKRLRVEEGASYGHVVTEDKKINQMFVTYYEHLYSSHLSSSSSEIDSFLSRCEVPRLTREDTLMLYVLVTLREVVEASKQLPSGKSPGVDGLPPEWYKAYSEVSAPHLLNAFLLALDTGALPPSMNSASVVLIPKLGKDPMLCDSYCPISLLNTDTKILAKALANRLNQVLLKIVHLDQNGFISGKSTMHNLRQLFTHLSLHHDNLNCARGVKSDTTPASTKPIKTFVPPFKKNLDTVSNDQEIHTPRPDANVLRTGSTEVCKKENNVKTTMNVLEDKLDESDVLQMTANLQCSRDMQDMRIRKKQRQKIRPQPGSLYLLKASAAKRISLVSAVQERHPTLYSTAQLHRYGVVQNHIGVNSENAGSFQFHCMDYFTKEQLLSGNGIQLADGGWLIPTNAGKAGKEEIYRTLCDTPGVDPKLISPDWVYNHYRWIIWKLAAMELRFPETFASRCLTPERVLLQLKYRYDVEIDKSQRSAIKKIMERDDSPAKTLVLCISKILSYPSSNKNEQDDSKQVSAVIEVTDGWYGIKALLDPALTALLRSGRLFIGQKIIVHGAELTGSEDACTPLEAPESLMLKIAANSTRPARWYARLGYFQDPRPFCLRLSSLYCEGGIVGCVDVLIQRIYPMQWMEKMKSGLYVFRNDRAEEREAEKHSGKQQKNLEILFAKIQAEFEEQEACNTKRKGLRRQSLSVNQIRALQDGSEIYDAIQNESDPGYFESCLSTEQLRALNHHKQILHDKKQAHIQAVFRKAIESSEQGADGCARREVTAVWKLRIADYRDQDPDTAYILNIWRPLPDVLSLLKEGSRFKMFHLAASQPKSKSETANVQLTATKKTRYQQLQPSQNILEQIYCPREATEFSRLLLPGFSVPYSEVDLVGLVIATHQKAGAAPLVYLSDKSQHLVAVKFWTDLGQLALEEIAKPCTFIAASNLRWRSECILGIPTVYAGDLSFISSNPKESHLQKAIQKLKHSIQCVQDFCHKAGTKMMNVLQVNNQEDRRSLASCSLDPSTPSWKSDVAGGSSLLTPVAQSGKNILNSIHTPELKTSHPACSRETDLKTCKKRKGLEYLSRIPSPPPVTPVRSLVSPSLQKAFRPPRSCGIQKDCVEERVSAGVVINTTLTHGKSKNPAKSEGGFVADEELAMINTQALLLGLEDQYTAPDTSGKTLAVPHKEPQNVNDSVGSEDRTENPSNTPARNDLNKTLRQTEHMLGFQRTLQRKRKRK
ncbi:breast cancer type 2 susceptibility protein [Rhinophrynus dorsalis]